MKRSAWIATIVASSALSAFDAGAQRSRAEDDEDFRSRIDTAFAFPKGGVVDLSLVSGDIVVTGTSRAEARIKAHSERGRLRVNISASRITLDVSSERGRMGDTRFEVVVPEGVRVVLRSTTGDIASTGTKGDVEVKTMSGDIEIADVVGKLTIESVSGEVRAERVKGDVEIETVGGSIELADVDGGVRIETTSGDIGLENIRSRNVVASTVSGEVEYAGSVEHEGRYEFHSHSGEITLRLPSTVNARFDIETFNGSLDSEYPITMQPGERGSRRPRRFEFTLGSGGARVVAETFSGDITLGRGARR